jgi:acetylornithine/succinyldiaminopimelate/putrescine aminotransferase
VSIDFDRQVFLHRLAQTSASPFGITVERAEGSWLYSPDGTKYLDLISGIAVTNIGHRHPRVVKAIKDQVDRHLHVMAYGEYIQAPSNRLAAKLASLLPPSLNCTYLVNSGTEANEAALKLAKRITGKTRMIACRQSYHGSTHGSMSVSGNEVKKRTFRPLLPDVHFMDFGCVSDLEKITDETACVIMETIQGDAGVRIPSREYLAAIRERCSQTGALLILDEIQCGMGRTGKLFAFEHFGVVPDILTVAKAFGGGLPIGALISSEENLRAFTFDPALGHVTTFGGNPVCAASALATLEVLLEEKIIEGVESKGQLIESLLKHPDIREVRRIGLMMAFDFDSAERVNRIVDYAKGKGVICYWFLSQPHSFRLAPPLNISEADIRHGCNMLLEAIEKTKN